MDDLEELPLDPEEALLELRAQRRLQMQEQGGWYRDNGDEVFPPRFIALGRHEWYTPFAHARSEALGTEVYLLDFLIWVNMSDPQGSLLWYIRQAERIDIHLKGISAQDLYQATFGAAGLKDSRRTLRIPYMTSWEINQVFWTPELRARAWWHLAGEHTLEQAYGALGGQVDRERLVEFP